MSNTEVKQPITIGKAAFTLDVKAGMSKEDLATKYSIAKGNVAKIAKDLGLKLKRNIKPVYVLVDDSTEVTA